MAPRVAPVRFGRFRLLRRLSLGPTAEVFQAEVGRPRKTVVVKRMLPSAAEDDDALAMFVAEARLAAQLRHPRICRLEEWGRIRNSPYISMEYVDGLDLRRLKRARGPMEPLVVATIGLQIAQGLHYAHGFVDAAGRRLKVIHRDISPQNVMVGRDGRVRLIDFGIAKYEGREGQTAAGVLKGKHGYMSPEQVRGESLDGRTDLFSLAILLYEMITGEPLFKGDCLLETLERVEAAVVRPLASVATCPPALSDVIMATLARDRRQRPACAADVADLLSRTLGAGAAQPDVIVRDFLQRDLGELLDSSDADELGAYRQTLRSAEDEGVETTDQRGVTDATAVLVR